MTTETQQTSTPTTAGQGTHHYVMTLDVPGYAAFTTSGTFTPRPGATRKDVFDTIYKNATSTNDDPRMRRPNVTFFSLESNQL